MGKFMRTAGSLLCESLPADLTSVGPFPRMDPLVSNHVFLAMESFIAEMTWKPTGSAVVRFVCSVLGMVCEFFATIFTEHWWQLCQIAGLGHGWHDSDFYGFLSCQKGGGTRLETWTFEKICRR